MLLARLITFEVALMFLWLELYVTCCLKMLSAGCLLANREWEYFVTGTSTIRGWQTLGHLLPNSRVPKTWFVFFQTYPIDLHALES